MPLREHKIRVSDAAWALIANEAQDQGVSISQYVAEAALARATYDWTRRGGGGVPEYQELVDCARGFAAQFEAPN